MSDMISTTVRKSRPASRLNVRDTEYPLPSESTIITLADWWVLFCVLMMTFWPLLGTTYPRLLRDLSLQLIKLSSMERAAVLADPPSLSVWLGFSQTKDTGSASFLSLAILAIFSRLTVTVWFVVFLSAIGGYINSYVCFLIAVY